MNDNSSLDQFPLHGVIGVVANGADEIALACERKLQSIEVRADLLLDTGLSVDDILELVKFAKKQQLACLFTLRHPDHGGTFSGSESERVSINRKALEVGVDICDVEWDTNAALQLLADDAPVILSYHNFSGMPDETALTELTRSMSAVRPKGIKVVPTAESLADASRMLSWVEDAHDNIRRIGFAMGEAGECSRILTLAYGAPVTYATFGKTVAPGQIDIDLLLTQYRAQLLNTETTVVAVSGSQKFCTATVLELNERYQSLSENRVAIAFKAEWLDTTSTLLNDLKIVERVAG